MAPPSTKGVEEEVLVGQRNGGNIHEHTKQYPSDHRARLARPHDTCKGRRLTRYQYDEGVSKLAQKALGVHMMREDRAAHSAFVTISYWEDFEAMSRYAGDDPSRIHHLERDAEFLIELPQSIQVLNILRSIERTGGEA